MINFLAALKNRLRKDNPRWIILMVDMCLVFLSYILSIYILYNSKVFSNTQLVLKKLIFIGVVYFICFLYQKTYKSIVRQTGFRDTVKIFKTTVIAYFILVLLMIMIRVEVDKDSVIAQYLRIPYSVLTMQFCVSMLLIVGVRVIYRAVFEYLILPPRKIENVLIFGASRTGFLTHTRLNEDPDIKYHIVAFVEDKLSRVGNRLAGLKILNIKDINEVFIRKYRISDVVIAVENNDPERLQYISQWFHQLGLELKIISPVRLLSNSRKKSEIRPLEIDDLLGRKAIKLDNLELEAEMDGKVILVTGAAGSIGSELARQIAKRSYKKLILVDQSESPLYDIQQSIKCSVPHNLHCIVADVRNYAFMQKIFADYRPDLVFHAAAYKHVPLMEANPYESIQTNVLGSKNIADLSVKYQVKKMVLVSTDKAVNPTNIMGATKRIAEIYISSCSGRSLTQFIITRFGNVLGSNGSVIPLFEKQMEYGGPLTLTHPDITRYFMTIPEACLLVQEAGVMGKGGEIFVFDMGKSIRIIDLAKRMINLKGYRYPEDIDIQIVGLRPGEKIYEELLANNENTIKTHHPKIMIAHVNHEELELKVELINDLCQKILSSHYVLPDFLNLVKCMKKIVPEFKSQNSEFEILDGKIRISDI